MTAREGDDGVGVGGSVGFDDEDDDDVIGTNQREGSDTDTAAEGTCRTQGIRVGMTLSAENASGSIAGLVRLEEVWG